MKTVQNLIDEERERQTTKYENILVRREDGSLERHSAPANIKEGEWLEFDTTCDITDVFPNSKPTTRHIKTKGTIVEYVEIRM